MPFCTYSVTFWQIKTEGIFFVDLKANLNIKKIQL